MVTFLPASLTKEEIPVLFHEPHVLKGFRQLHYPWHSYFLSIFQWHNELLNIWTHLLALIMVLIRGGMWWMEFDLISDPYMWPLSVGIITMIILYMCSSGAHCLQNRSELVHYTCFMFDYAGIGLYGFGSTMLHYWYCLHESFLGSLSHQLAIPVGAVLALLVCICCSISKTKYKRPYPFTRRIWQMSSVLSIYIWLIFPIWYRIWLFVRNGAWEASFKHHLQQMFWFTLGGFFFGSDIPQRFSPGTFDILGHSHQLFHMCIFMTTYEQLNALYLEITDSVVVHEMEAPTFLNTWGVLAAVIVANAFVVYYFHTSVCAKLEREHKEQEEVGGEEGSKDAGQCCATGGLVNGTSTHLRQRNGIGHADCH
ncbi:membrane progestin receptor beta-like [Physella acuta]|uniref:membrane progestin receptor beta-like n=1 Tax=Physella acuta TaxID=109671 RepID=UPI0027DC35D6|nr:membrane progestin receptor beta-like [Physella acuta]